VLLDKQEVTGSSPVSPTGTEAPQSRGFLRFWPQRVVRSVDRRKRQWVERAARMAARARVSLDGAQSRDRHGWLNAVSLLTRLAETMVEVLLELVCTTGPATSADEFEIYDLLVARAEHHHELQRRSCAKVSCRGGPRVLAAPTSTERAAPSKGRRRCRFRGRCARPTGVRPPGTPRRRGELRRACLSDVLRPSSGIPLVHEAADALTPDGLRRVRNRDQRSANEVTLGRTGRHRSHSRRAPRWAMHVAAVRRHAVISQRHDRRGRVDCLSEAPRLPETG
jgi:hypothetical protein